MQDSRRHQSSSHSNRDRDEKRSSYNSSRYDDDDDRRHHRSSRQRHDDDYGSYSRRKDIRHRSKSKSRDRNRHKRSRSRERTHSRRPPPPPSMSYSRSPSREQQSQSSRRTSVETVAKEKFESYQMTTSSKAGSSSTSEHPFSFVGSNRSSSSTSSIKLLDEEEREESRSQSPNSIRNIVLPNETKRECSNDDDDDSNAFDLDGNIVEIDKEHIQKEMQERLRQHLAAEGKVYPLPRPQAHHPVFANDGSFLETFKQLQHHQQQMMQAHQVGGSTAYQHLPYPAVVVQEVAEPKVISTVIAQQPAPTPLPLFGKRRGGKILKTGIVEKPKPIKENETETAKDAWSMYMQEVKKYKTTACDVASKTRPLLK